MDANTKRCVAYPAAAAIIGGLLFLGFGYESEADYGMLVGSAGVQAELAAAFPGDGDGAELRRELLSQAESYLARAAAVRPDGAAVLEIRARIAGIRGRMLEAARLYREARELPGCPADARGALALNEARALLLGLDYERAIAVLEGFPPSADQETKSESRLLHARVLRRSGRTEEARRAAISIVGSSAPGDRSCVGAALILEDLADWRAAEDAYRKAHPQGPLRDYCLARLKIRAGEIDRALELLKRSVDGSGPMVRRLLRQDREIWAPCAGDERFRSLQAPSGEVLAPGAGR